MSLRWDPVALALLLALGLALSGCMGDTDEEGDGGGDVGGDESPSPSPTDETGDGGDGGAGTSADDPASGTVTVEMDEFSFAPEEVWVEPGTTVRWTNGGSLIHTATATDQSWDTGDVVAGESAEESFDETGTFDYVCTYHEAQGMVATLHVV